MLESTISKNVFLGDGTATAFPFDFRVWDTSQLLVVLTSPAGETSTATGWTAELTESGGTLTYLHNGAPLPGDWKLAIVRNMPFVQEVDLITGTRFDPEVVETALDVATAERQQLLERLARAVVVEPTDEAGPEALLADIREARTSAAASAGSAQANANAAAESARSAAGSAAVATEQREAACICAGEAKGARDAAVLQAEAANTLMEAELAKVNAIVAANRTDQQAAVTAARAWAEKAPDTPVEYDEDGNPRYSARHWAENAQKIAIEPPTAERRGSIRVGAGLHLETGENGEKDVLTADLATQESPGLMQPDGVTMQVNDTGVLSALGGNLLLNEEEWITVSGTWAAKATGWHEVFLINGGMGGMISAGTAYIKGGDSGSYDRIFVYLEKGQEVPVVIGAGGSKKVTLSGTAQWPAKGGLTYFGTYTARFNNELPGNIHYTQSNDYAKYGAAGGFGGDPSSSAPRFYGAGGGVYYRSTTDYAASDGASGAICVRWHDPDKAAGPLSVATFRMAREAKLATVNLYDPETGQGSVWYSGDAPAKLAEGMITEAAWKEICAQKAAEAYDEWLTSYGTLAERFELLRAARDAKLAATDYLVAPDYPLTDEQRAAVMAYRQALRDLPAQAGAPWDGGGEATPWPEDPAVTKVQEV